MIGLKEQTVHGAKSLADAHARHRAHEYPREIDFIDEFPVTVTGKIRRRDLREREAQRKTGREPSSSAR